jgi:hypothetical protein
MAKEKTFIRNPAVTETDIDDEIFLVEPASEEVFYMDTVSAGLWRLLAEPSSFEEIAAVYGAASSDPNADDNSSENKEECEHKYSKPNIPKVDDQLDIDTVYFVVSWCKPRYCCISELIKMLRERPQAMPQKW